MPPPTPSECVSALALPPHNRTLFVQLRTLGSVMCCCVPARVDRKQCGSSASQRVGLASRCAVCHFRWYILGIDVADRLAARRPAIRLEADTGAAQRPEGEPAVRYGRCGPNSLAILALLCLVAPSQVNRQLERHMPLQPTPAPRMLLSHLRMTTSAARVSVRWLHAGDVMPGGVLSVQRCRTRGGGMRRGA